MSGVCQAAPWFSFGHLFKARYEQRPIPDLSISQTNMTMLIADCIPIPDQLCHRVYVRDVCTRCGATIEREPTP